MKYSQLTKEERFAIDLLFNKEKRSIGQIAKILKRNKSTISKELKRNTNFGYYENEIVEFKRKNRQKHKFFFRLWRYKEFTNLFLKFFSKRIHGVKNTWIKIRDEFPNVLRPSWREVYHWIRKGYWSIKRWDRLRPFYIKGRKRKQGIFSKFKSKFVLPIWTRPKIIDLKQEYGHWEADFIIGKKSNEFQNLLTLTERKTRVVFIKKISSKNSMKCNSALYKMIKENNLVV